MTGTLGRIALAAGLFAALAAVLLWRRVAIGRDTPQAARIACTGVLLSALGAVSAAEWALLRHDFSVRFVAEHGSRSTPRYYTVTSLWSSLDGSMLLWLLVLAGWLLWVARRVPVAAPGLQPWAALTASAVTAFFFGLALTTGSMFDPVAPVPADGPGPNPLLADHPAMGIHPPLLYAGYVGMVVPFGYALAALITGRFEDWLTAIRGSLLTAWCLLTAGIVMGAWWSYAVLGWGGYWGWDPVENASILPWFLATALLHGALVQQRTGALRCWNISLAAAAFLVVCVGTFLTRSDAVASVHSFTQSALGPALACFVIALTATVVGLVIWRADSFGDSPRLRPGANRTTALLVNNLLLVTLTAIVLLGTVYPLLATMWGQRGIAVGTPYFAATVTPVAFALVLMLALVPALTQDQQGLGPGMRRLAVPAAIGLGVVAALGAVGVRGRLPVATFGLAAMCVAGSGISMRRALSAARALTGSTWAAVAARRRRLGGELVHVAVAVAAVGLAAAGSYPTVREAALVPGGTVRVAGTTVRLDRVSNEQSVRWNSTVAAVQLGGRGGAHSTRTRLRFSPAHDMTVTQPAIRSHWWGDVYVSLLDVTPNGAATLRVAITPLIGLLWGAGALLVAGGALAAVPGRRCRPVAPALVPGPSSRPEEVPV